MDCKLNKGYRMTQMTHQQEIEITLQKWAKIGNLMDQVDPVGHGMTHQQKLEAAIEYLNDRNIYLLNSKYRPTPPESTDIRKTFDRYIKESKTVR